MKRGAYICLFIAGISLIMSLVSRFTLTPVNMLPGGLEASAFLQFTNTCIIIANTFFIVELLKK